MDTNNNANNNLHNNSYNDSKIKKIMRHIPGFRSNVTWKKIIASFYYLFALFNLFVVEFWAFLFYVALPFAVFGLIDLWKAKIKSKKMIATFVIPLVICFAAVAISNTVKDLAQPITVKNQQPDNKQISNDKNTAQDSKTNHIAKEQKMNLQEQEQNQIPEKETLSDQQSQESTPKPEPAEATPTPQESIPAATSPTTTTPAPTIVNTSTIVYTTDTGSKYHRNSSRTLKDSKYETTLEKAKAQGYTPCGICNPPQ